MTQEAITTFPATHSCFDDAMDFFDMFDVEDEEVRGEMYRSLRLVHGICRSSSGVHYAHAWVEEHVTDDSARADWPAYVVWQGTIVDGRRAYYALDRTFFYQAWMVMDRTIYTMHELARCNALSGHCGPWIRRYIALARSLGGGRVLGSVSGARALGVVFADAAELEL